MSLEENECRKKLLQMGGVKEAKYPFFSSGSSVHETSKKKRKQRKK